MQRYTKLINTLQKQFGHFDFDQKKFTKKSNSEIARELFYSDSQFSRLINQTASEGEYDRAIKVVERYLEYQQLKSVKKSNSNSMLPYLASGILKSALFLVFLILCLLTIAQYLFKGDPATSSLESSIPDTKPGPNEPQMDNMLRWSFEDADVNSYTNLSDLPEDCDFPCYRLQGQWKLKTPYKIPVFAERNGFHYVATEVNMYAKCMDTRNGDWLEGYEYQKHEIWYDTKTMKVDSFLLNPEQPFLRPDYLEMDFNQTYRFLLIAQVHTFFRNEFEILDNQLRRKGQVIGRNIEYENLDELVAVLPQYDKKDLETLVNDIIRKRVGDYSKPVQCSTFTFHKENFNEFEEREEMVYDCLMTTGRFPVSYQKIYFLENQYIKNKCRPQLSPAISSSAIH